MPPIDVTSCGPLRTLLRCASLGSGMQFFDSTAHQFTSALLNPLTNGDIALYCDLTQAGMLSLDLTTPSALRHLLVNCSAQGRRLLMYDANFGRLTTGIFAQSRTTTVVQFDAPLGRSDHEQATQGGFSAMSTINTTTCADLKRAIFSAPSGSKLMLLDHEGERLVAGTFVQLPGLTTIEIAPNAHEWELESEAARKKREEREKHHPLKPPAEATLFAGATGEPAAGAPIDPNAPVVDEPVEVLPVPVPVAIDFNDVGGLRGLLSTVAEGDVLMFMTHAGLRVREAAVAHGSATLVLLCAPATTQDEEEAMAESGSTEERIEKLERKMEIVRQKLGLGPTAEPVAGATGATGATGHRDAATGRYTAHEGAETVAT